MNEKTVSDETFCATMNAVINDPLLSIDCARDLSSSLQRLMFMPPEIVEQLITKLETDVKRLSNRLPKDNPILEALLGAVAPGAIQKANRCLGLLKAFLAVRTAFVNELKLYVAQDDYHPDWIL